jgi:hypothetical protein
MKIARLSCFNTLSHASRSAAGQRELAEALHLLDVEHGATLHERNIALRLSPVASFVSVRVSCRSTCKLSSIDRQIRDDVGASASFSLDTRRP